MGSARTALKLNVDARSKYKYLPDFIWSGHCHWYIPLRCLVTTSLTVVRRSLLKAPITPFLVVFCSIIAHPSTSSGDLELLIAFVATLHDLRRFSDGMLKMYALCDIFCKVATLYVRAKGKEARLEPSADWMGQPAVNDIDGYLSTMGFAPFPADANVMLNELGGNDEFSFLSDWHEGSNSLMGFLEQDLTFYEGLDVSL